MPQQGGFPGPGRSDQSDHLAGRNSQADLAQGLAGAKSFGHGLDLDGSWGQIGHGAILG
jgi:hypothetical protein